MATIEPHQHNAVQRIGDDGFKAAHHKFVWQVHDACVCDGTKAELLSLVDRACRCELSTHHIVSARRVPRCQSRSGIRDSSGTVTCIARSDRGMVPIMDAHAAGRKLTVYVPTKKAVAAHAFEADERIVFVEPGVALVYSTPQNEVEHLGMDYRPDSHCRPSDETVPQLYITHGSRTPGCPLPSRVPSVPGYEERVVRLLGIVRR